MLAAVRFDQPIIWAVLIGWIFSVILHELAHGVVAYWGGDYTIRERGGLTLNPLQYVDPFGSIILPIIFLVLGGIPLPGGVTYVRRDLLRSRHWEAAMSAAGPAMNVLLFFACALPLHPMFHLFDLSRPDEQLPNTVIFLGAMAVLQIVAALFNLVPILPLDGFNIIGAYMNHDLRRKLAGPPVGMFLFIAFFVLLWRAPDLMGMIYHQVVERLLSMMGFDEVRQDLFRRSFNLALFGTSG